MTPVPRYVYLVHPASLPGIAAAFDFTIPKDGRMSAESGWTCQVCGDRAHVGACDPEALRLAELALEGFFSCLPEGMVHTRIVCGGCGGPPDLLGDGACATCHRLHRAIAAG